MLSKPNRTCDPIHFIDLEAQQKRIRPQIESRIIQILDHGKYIMGPEVAELEARLADFCQAKHVLSTSNGTDALSVFLRAKRVKPGDAIFVPGYTFCATAEVVALIGAHPVFIDVCPDTFNMNSESLERGIRTAKAAGLNPVGIIPVDLFGQPADYEAIEAVAEENELWVLCDSAQSLGASYKGRKVGSIGMASTTSFFPAKPLGCYGDGGCIFTQDDDLADKMRSIRIHGKGSHKYDNVNIGMNARLDTMQAAILIEKLSIFPEEILRRQTVAEIYNSAFRNVAKTPVLMEKTTSVWAQYTILVRDEAQRNRLREDLAQHKIPTAIYYDIPLYRQKAYENFLTETQGELPVSEDLSKRAISLPMHAYLDESVQSYICDVIYQSLKNS